MSEKKALKNMPIAMAFVGIIPVVLFAVSTVLLSSMLGERLLLAGAILCLLSGLVKSLGEIIFVLKKKSVEIFNTQSRFLIPLGVGIIAVCLFMNKDKEQFVYVFSCFKSFPADFFLISFGIGIGFMLLADFVLNHDDIRAEWIIRIINIVAQLVLLISVLIVVFFKY